MNSEPNPESADDEGLDKAAAEQFLAAEGEEAERAAKKAREDAKGLLRYVDKELADVDFVMPAFRDPLDSMRYVASAVKTRRDARDVRDRRDLIKKVSIFTGVWIFVVLAILVTAGFRIHGFKLPSGVLIALVTTTTGNVLGLAYVVLRGLFYRQDTGQVPAAERPSSNVPAKKGG